MKSRCLTSFLSLASLAHEMDYYLQRITDVLQTHRPWSYVGLGLMGLGIVILLARRFERRRFIREVNRRRHQAAVSAYHQRSRAADPRGRN